MFDDVSPHRYIDSHPLTLQGNRLVAERMAAMLGDHAVGTFPHGPTTIRDFDIPIYFPYAAPRAGNERPFVDALAAAAEFWPSHGAA